MCGLWFGTFGNEFASLEFQDHFGQAFFSLQPCCKPNIPWLSTITDIWKQNRKIYLQRFRVLSLVLLRIFVFVSILEETFTNSDLEDGIKSCRLLAMHISCPFFIGQYRALLCLPYELFLMHDSYEIYVPSKSFLIFLDIWTSTLKWKTVVSSSSSYAKFTVQSGRASRAIVGCDLANPQWGKMQPNFIAPTRPKLSQGACSLWWKHQVSKVLLDLSFHTMQCATPQGSYSFTTATHGC